MPRRETTIRTSDQMDTQSGFPFCPAESNPNGLCSLLYLHAKLNYLHTSFRGNPRHFSPKAARDVKLDHLRQNSLTASALKSGFVVRTCNRTAALQGSRFAPTCSAMLAVTLGKIEVG